MDVVIISETPTLFLNIALNQHYAAPPTGVVFSTFPYPSLCAQSQIPTGLGVSLVTVAAPPNQPGTRGAGISAPKVDCAETKATLRLETLRFVVYLTRSWRQHAWRTNDDSG
jgi:hypothetical protein